ncbi:Long-chain fatty acid transport protein [Salinimicrobium catena]|uniref:Long-chain fatty acid transport protein n=1 Tax=Salinimicrobium catena TaxID=390640 RepID=A0A1H5JX83_9FLAO|nr:hypothetical protein [Salinimicrobium catena]SDK91416.1 Long-chain fatty acid transport protein [Salinimicrobium catena]SEE57146.1 Long-chain fatty acid transport protein [Salinimicrobium catena]
MTKRFLIIVFILFSVITTAQERTSSPYSFYGIGLNTFKGTVENQSMGGLSIFSDSIHLNLRNPAAYGKLALTTYGLGASHTATEVMTSEESGTANKTSFDYLAVGIPTGKLGFGFGLIPYTSVGYDILDRNEANNTASRYTGKGGLNKVFLAAGYEINENISVGVDVNYNFGNLQNKNIFIREGLQYGSREINRSDLSGFTYKIGLAYERMLNEDLQFMFGGHYTPEANLSSANERELATIIFTGEGMDIAADTRQVEVADGDLTLPSSYTLGTGIGKPRKWFFGVEYTGSEASDFSNRSFALEGATYNKSNSYKAGGYFIPNYSSLTSYFSRVVYRAGLRMDETGLNLDGEDINEFGITFGVGLPAGRMLSNVNLGFEYGQRGTKDSGLVLEDFFVARISLSLNDRWFVKRKFE